MGSITTFAALCGALGWLYGRAKRHQYMRQHHLRR